MTAFIAGGALDPVENQNIIIHRKELDQLISHLENKDFYVALESPCQTGKTTLLYQIYHRLRGQGYGIVYLDFSGFNNLDEAEFYQIICRTIKAELDTLIVPSQTASLEPENIDSQIAFENYLKFLAAHTPQIHKLIFILEEIGGIPEKVCLTLFPYLRRFFNQGRIQSRERDLYRKILFIFSGVLDLSRLMQGINSPLRNICKNFTLNDFSQEQVLSLAQKNLDNFSSERVKPIAKYVYDWCDGHPYLTQRLYGLIDENQECRSASIDRLSEIIDRLVKTHIIYGSDVNVNQILNYLRKEDKSYRDAVSKILNNELLKSVRHDKELLTVGIFKRMEDLHLVIRNKIYEQSLKIAFAHMEKN